MMRVAMKLRLAGRNHETTLSIMIKDQLRCPSTHALRRLIIIYRTTALEMGGLILNTGAGFKFVILGKRLGLDNCQSFLTPKKTQR